MCCAQTVNGVLGETPRQPICKLCPVAAIICADRWFRFHPMSILSYVNQCVQGAYVLILNSPKRTRSTYIQETVSQSNPQKHFLELVIFDYTQSSTLFKETHKPIDNVTQHGEILDKTTETLTKHVSQHCALSRWDRCIGGGQCRLLTGTSGGGTTG